MAKSKFKITKREWMLIKALLFVGVPSWLVIRGFVDLIQSKVPQTASPVFMVVLGVMWLLAVFFYE